MQARMYLKEISAAYSDAPIRNTSDAAKVLQKNFEDLDREYFISVNLDSQNRPISYSIISMGDLGSVHFPIAPIFKYALLQNARSVMLCHNHPGGGSSPSSEDFDATRSIVEAGKMLGIKVMDHFILTPTDYVSMKEEQADLFQ